MKLVLARCAFPVVAVFSVCCLTDCAAVRQTLGLGLVPVETEVELGRQLATEIESQQRLLPDDLVQEYVVDIALPLLRASRADRSDLRYRVAVLDDPEQVNAFALPGGFIYVYSGLLLFARDEAEVAGVLAHEIGHVVGRHSANRLATQMGMGVLLSLALGQAQDELAETAAQLAGEGTLAAFSREDEREADRFGVAYTVAAGYDPRGLVTFFTRLLQHTGDGSRQLSYESLMSSHPATSERIRDVERLIAAVGDVRATRTGKERFDSIRAHLLDGYRGRRP